jgi:toxin ParE1/3/4
MKRQVAYSQEFPDQLKMIGNYTKANWGVKQRNKYMAEIRSGIQTLQDKPTLGKPRDDLFPGMRSYRIQRHYIYYYFNDTEVYCVAILHVSMDPFLNL